ncbi:MAG: electron transport complex subunit E [Chromatiales bacterium]|nr:electron transport complex subunit E [Chromatiales bacterium]
MTTQRPDYRSIIGAGLWWNNPGMAQLLGLCPLLAVSRSLVTGLALGLATLAVVTATNVLVSATRSLIHHHLRLPAYVLIIATFVTCIDLLFMATWFDLYLRIGLFIPLIVTNCAILGRAESFASRQPVLPSLVDGLAQGSGFALLLVAMGTVRELVGRGTLLADAELLFGPGATDLAIRVGDGGLSLATLPPGAFLVLALFVAARNALLARGGRHEASGSEEHAP